MVKVDATRRIYIPKDLPFEAQHAILIPQAGAYLLIPVPKEPILIDVKASVTDLKGQAERRAKQDAVARARRRHQL